jgi:hypothetical protein
MAVVVRIFVRHFPTAIPSHVLILTKQGWASIWPIFSQTHLVTLVSFFRLLCACQQSIADRCPNRKYIGPEFRDARFLLGNIPKWVHKYIKWYLPLSMPNIRNGCFIIIFLNFDTYFTRKQTISMRIKSQRNSIAMYYVLKTLHPGEIRTHDLKSCWRRQHMATSARIFELTEKFMPILWKSSCLHKSVWLAQFTPWAYICI